MSHYVARFIKTAASACLLIVSFWESFDRGVPQCKDPYTVVATLCRPAMAGACFMQLCAQAHQE